MDVIHSVHQMIGGMDEAGRGPLAGPVVASIVVFHPDDTIVGLKDSKQLSPKRREQFSEHIKKHAKAWSISSATAFEIDTHNILQATFLAMSRAFDGIDIELDCVYVDGNRAPNLPIRVVTIIKGDQKVAQISAASILAKVERDRYMTELDKRHSDYGFAQHKGYPTAAHVRALELHGPCPEHRRSFAPVRKTLDTRATNHI